MLSTELFAIAFHSLECCSSIDDRMRALIFQKQGKVARWTACCSANFQRLDQQDTVHTLSGTLACGEWGGVVAILGRRDLSNVSGDTVDRA